jgi:hypothetical protein
MIFSTQLMLEDMAENGADIAASVAANEMPKSAAFIAGQSFAPSPHIEHTTPNFLNARITIALCSGLHLPNNGVFSSNYKIGSSSLIFKSVSSTAPFITICLSAMFKYLLLFTHSSTD